ncbi:MAG: DUF1641 domain-containing protein [Chloroflexi bacterium]|nr:DUF1641 domain-containing protein [Chloroflexota bacterium]
METSLAELNHKIDLLTQQVAYLTAQAQQAERARQDRAELVHDLAPVANDAFRLATEQLAEVQEYVDLNDMLRLFKRLLRNTPMLERMLDQMESMSELIDTLMPLGDQAFAKAVDTLQRMEQKGYFMFAQGGMQIADNIVTSFTEEDVKKLGENIVLILNVVKGMTQPEIMQFVHNILRVAEKEIEQPVDTSFPALLKQMRDPNVKRGLALTMRVMSVVGAQAEPSKN